MTTGYNSGARTREQAIQYFISNPSVRLEKMTAKTEKHAKVQSANTVKPTLLRNFHTINLLSD